MINYKVTTNGTNDAPIIHTYSFCTINYHSFVRSIGEGRYFSAFFWLRVALFVFIPCILLIIFSIILIFGLRKVQIRRKRLIKSRSNVESSIESSTTLMLAVVTIIFLVVNLPQGISLGLFSIEMTTGLTIMDRETFLLINVVDNLLILATFPINFAIYCSMSTQFRTTFKALFVRRNSRDPDRSMISMATTQLEDPHRPFSAAAANGDLLHFDPHEREPSQEELLCSSRSPTNSQTVNLLMNAKV